MKKTSIQLVERQATLTRWYVIVPRYCRQIDLYTWEYNVDYVVIVSFLICTTIVPSSKRGKCMLEQGLSTTCMPLYPYIRPCFPFKPSDPLTSSSYRKTQSIRHVHAHNRFNHIYHRYPNSDSWFHLEREELQKEEERRNTAETCTVEFTSGHDWLWAAVQCCWDRICITDVRRYNAFKLLLLGELRCSL
jgi:hypothetical protein